MGTSPSELSRQLREGVGPDLARRRGIVGLSLAAMGSMGLVTLYQMGILRRLPEPPLPHFDAECVDASAEAYAALAMPDGALALMSYAVTLALAAAGGAERARDRPWLPLALAAKVAFDTAEAVRLTADQWTKHRAFCFWCLLAAGATVATAPLAAAEAVAAARRLARG
ncbi:MAG TPA: vitamin K epoxide reductase family protein [Thermomicrobiales bacterium]|nr:vitamin K epoxide reductase family protein [Thermomicrobiales bacterium]